LGVERLVAVQKVNIIKKQTDFPNFLAEKGGRKKTGIPVSLKKRAPSRGVIGHPVWGGVEKARESSLLWLRHD